MIAALALLAAVPLAAGSSSCDRWLQGLYGKLPYAEYSVVDRAARCLEGNTGGGHETIGMVWPWLPRRAARPSSSSFFGVWNWDCAFMALAMAKWDAELARDQFRVFADLQRADGMYPDCWKWVDGGAFREGVFDGASKPPVLAWAVWTVHRASPDRAFLESAYDSLRRNVAWWHERRGGARDVLLHYDGEASDEATRRKYAGWESGMDDSPRWDGRPWQLFPMDLNCYMLMTYRAMRDFAAELGKEDDRLLWIARAKALADAIETRLWDESEKCYYDWDFVEKKFSRVLTPASFLPLFAGLPSQERAAAMARHAERLSPGWPTVAYEEPSFDPVGYWRGRTWVNMAYFALRGLKWYGYDELAEKGRATVLGWMMREPSNFNENYNPLTGRPLGAMYFGWSSAFAIKFVLDWDKPRNEEMPQ